MTLDLAAGRAEKQLGLDLVEANNQTAIQRMREFAQIHAEYHGSVSIDAVREWADKVGVVVKHQNAYGAVFRGPRWRRIGFRPSRTPSAHARTVAVWALEG